MDLSARDIHEKQFHDSWRGYNQEEVDEFLDRIADVVDRLQRENSALNARITELDHAVSTSRDTEEMLKKTLVTAQQAAEEAIASAKAKAEALIQEAEERTRSAHREADEKLQTADAEARRKGLEADRELTIRRREIDASVEKLRRFESDLKRRLTGFLSEQSRALERLTEDEPPRYEPPQFVRGTDTAAAAAEANETAPSDDETDEGEGVPYDDAPRSVAASENNVTEEPTGQWIPDFVASNEIDEEEAGDAAHQPGADDEAAWQEPPLSRDTDIGSLYATGELETLTDDPADNGSPSGDTVTLAEEENAGARQRSRLFWRNDG